MSYVPVLFWVDDTVDGPVTDAVRLKNCATCGQIIKSDAQADHDAEAHPPPPEVTPHYCRNTNKREKRRSLRRALIPRRTNGI